MERCIFLDRDGVIIEDVHYLHRAEDIKFLPFAIKGLLQLQKIGKLIIITNQSAVARGLLSLEGAYRLNIEISRRLRNKGVKIEKTYFCPHHPDFTGQCECRKPKIGLARKAAEELRINFEGSVFIGDKDSDIEFGINCGGVTFLIDNNQYTNTIRPDFRVKNLMEAGYILKNISKHYVNDF